ncbi:MAG: DUF1800 family protein [Alphaproteobacteria bacterium]|nr:MAG: DUF1800 family protein [Alphaproteobacteria bacterium]
MATIQKNSQKFTKKSKLALKAEVQPLASRADTVKSDFVSMETKVAMITRGVEAKTFSDPTAITPGIEALARATGENNTIRSSSGSTTQTTTARVRLSADVKSQMARAVISAGGNPSDGAPPPPPPPRRSSDYNNQLAAHRYGFLPTGAEMDQMRNIGVRPWMTNQLSNSGLDFGNDVVRYDERLRLFYDFRSQYGGLTTERLQILYNNYKLDGVQYYRQMALTNRPILHRLAQFFFNHLAGKFGMGDAEQYSMGIQCTSYFAHVILPNMFGKFEDMVMAATRFPALMQQYSVIDSIVNGNVQDWPREMMELHTVGSDAGYTQADVVALARLWTGHKIHQAANATADANGRIGGRWYFNAAQHDGGAKSFPFLGIEMAAYTNDRASGPDRLNQVLTALARHPATANRIAHKLLFHFVGDDPSWSGFQSAKDRIARVFIETQGDIMAIARALLLDINGLHPVPFKSPRPHDLLMGMVRAGNLVTRNANDTATENAFLETIMTNYLAVLGRPHLQVPDVRGYLVDNARWVNEGSIMQILDHVSMIAPRIAAKMSAATFYSNVISGLAMSPFMSSSSSAIEQFAATEPLNAIICTVMSPEVLMRRA